MFGLSSAKYGLALVQIRFTFSLSTQFHKVAASPHLPLKLTALTPRCGYLASLGAIRMARLSRRPKTEDFRAFCHSRTLTGAHLERCNMVSPALHVLYDKRRGTARIEDAMLKPLWRFRAPTGEVVCTIPLQDVINITVLIFESGGMALALSTKRRHFCFISTKPADENWDAALADLRAATRGQSTAFRAPLTRTFPPIEYLRGPLLERSAAKKEPLTLFSLPQELLDIIFKLAYPHQEGLVLKNEEDWYSAQRLANRENDTAIPLSKFKPKVCEFMVSRLFLQQAAKAWVSNQNFYARSGSGNCSARWLMRKIGQHQPMDILVRNIAILHTTCSRPVISITSNFPSLLVLNLEVHVGIFESLEPRFAWKEKFGEDDLEVISEKLAFDRLRGLKKLRLIPGPLHVGNKSDEQRLQWEENVAALEAFVLPWVTKARDTNVGPAGRKVDVLTSKMPSLAGVHIDEEGLMLDPFTLRPHRLKQTLEFISQNSTAILKAIDFLEVDEELATEFAALTI